MSSSAIGIIVLAVIGLVILAALVGAILLIRWAWKSQTSGGAQIAAYLAAGFLLLGLIGCPAVMLPVFMQARESAKRTACFSNLADISGAMQLYAADYDRLPPKAWTDPLADYVYGPESFACPALEQAFGYTFNSSLVGKPLASIKNPESTPMVFDGPGGKDSVGDDSLAQFRHMDEAVVGYANEEARRHKPGTIPAN